MRPVERRIGDAIVAAKAIPVICEADDTLTMDPGDLEKKINPSARAVICVHMFGHPCDMETIRRVAEDRGLFVIEDAAQAHGSEYRGKKAGSLGDVACFSFYASKTLTTGEGGMVLTDQSQVGWLRWRDDNARLLIAVRPAD